MWYSGSLQKFITALWAIRCAELFVESHRQHNGKYIFVPLPFYGNFAGMVRDNRVRNGQTESKMTVIRACFVCTEKNVQTGGHGFLPESDCRYFPRINKTYGCGYGREFLYFRFPGYSLMRY